MKLFTTTFLFTICGNFAMAEGASDSTSLTFDFKKEDVITSTLTTTDIQDISGDKTFTGSTLTIGEGAELVVDSDGTMSVAGSLKLTGTTTVSGNFTIPDDDSKTNIATRNDLDNGISDAEDYAESQAASALSSAKSYTDTKAAATLSSAQTYVASQAASALSSAKSYTDTKAASTLSTAKDYAESQAASALSSAKSYSDTKDASTLTSAKDYAASQASSALSSAKSYTDTKAASTLASAKKYADDNDDDTKYSAGTGLNLNDGKFSLNYTPQNLMLNSAYSNTPSASGNEAMAAGDGASASG